MLEGRRRMPDLGVAALLVLALGAVGLTGAAGSSRTHGRGEFSYSGALRAQLNGFNTHPHPFESQQDPFRGYAGWFYGQRAFPGTLVPAGALAAATRQSQHLRSTSRADSLGQPTWQNLGPMPTNGDLLPYNDPIWSNYGGAVGRETGRVTAMAVDPTNFRVVYEGGADGGVWKSTDSGGHWSAISNPIPTQSIGAIAIPPKAHNTLYVGTGEANTNADSYYGYGIFKSTNGGATWGKVGGATFDKMTVFQMITRGAGKLVFAATNRGLYRSRDGGNTWNVVLAPGDPAHFDSFVTGVQWTYQTKASLIAAVGYRGGRSTNGIYRSNDNGTTWSFLSSPPGFDAQSDIGRVALATTAGKPGLTYAAVQSVNLFNTPGAPTVFKGVYKSVHGAAGPWTEVEGANQMAQNQTSALTPQHNGCNCYNPGVQAWYNLYVSIDPWNPRDVVVGLEEVWNTRTGGSSWKVIGRYWDFCATPDQPWCYQGGSPSHFTTHPDQHGAGWGRNGSGKPVLYVGNDGGVWHQTGPAWSNNKWTDDNHRQSTTQCYSASASADGTIICGLQDNGFVKYTGRALWPAIAGGDGADGVIDPDDSDNIIGAYVDMNLYGSHDGGQTYDPNVGPADPNPRFISPVTLDPLDSTHLATVGQKVWESYEGFDTDSGDWVEAYDLGSGVQGTAVSAIDSTLYVGSCGGCNPSNFAQLGSFQSGLFTNQSGSWVQATADGLPNRYITSFVQDPSDDAHVYVTLSGFSRNWIPGGSVGHVFESTDAGETFTDISTDLPDAPISSAILNPVDGSLIVGTDTGIFQRGPNDGWQPLGKGFPTVVVSDLTTIPETNTIVAATHGRGVWTLDLS